MEKIETQTNTKVSAYIAKLYNFFRRYFELRRKLFYYLMRNVFKYPEGQMLNFGAKLLRFIILPLNTSGYILANKYSLYKPECDMYEIEGIKYSGYLFRGFGTQGFKEGTILKIVKRSDGYLTVEKVG